MPNKIYNVKQAAKILGLSTNTTYKYLNEGRIKAARGHIRGTFIITSSALENFLGSKIPDEIIQSLDSNQNQNTFKDGEAIIEVPLPTLATKVTRLLITISLLIIIADLVFNKDFSPITQISRITLIAIILLISYQYGGFVKK